MISISKRSFESFIFVPFLPVLPIGQQALQIPIVRIQTPMQKDKIARTTIATLNTVGASSCHSLTMKYVRSNASHI